MANDLKNNLQQILERTWYSKNGLANFLRPLSWLFISIATIRRHLYKYNILKSTRLSVPVIIVGNITVGGTGKTPLVIWLAEYLKAAGFKPGILSRGYSGKARSWPQQVRPDSDPVIVGDEAVVIARRTGCPMAVGPDRVAAGKALLKYSDCDVIICDDGLQHYALQREIEVLVIDGIRRFGNGYCLPAGPLRELPSRKNEVHCRVTNGIAAQGEYAMAYQGTKLINLLSGETRELKELKQEKVMAIAGIGNPDRFFNYLRSHGLRIETRAFPDHYHYEKDFLGINEDVKVIMTEKDAVKCKRFAKPNWWYVHVDVELPNEFGMEIINLLGKHHG